MKTKMKTTNVLKNNYSNLVRKIKKLTLIFSIFTFNLYSVVYATDNNEVIKGTVTDIFKFVQSGLFISGVVFGIMAGKSFSEVQSNDDPSANKAFRGQLTAALVLFAIALGITAFRDRILLLIGIQ